MAYNDQGTSILPISPDDAEAQLLAMLGLGPNDPLPAALTSPDAPPAKSDADSGTSKDTTPKDTDAPSKQDDASKASNDASIPATIAKPLAPASFGTGSPLGKIPLYGGNDASPSAPDQKNTPVSGSGIAGPIFSPQVQTAQQKLDDLNASGPGVSQKHGFLGGILKGLNIAGTILVPHAMAAIPGTTMNYRTKLAGAQGQLNSALDTQAKETATADQAQQITQRQLALNAMKPIGTPIETSQGTFQTFADKNGNPVVKKLDIPAGKSADYDLKETQDNRDTIPDPKDPSKQIPNPNKGQNVYASVNKVDPTQVKYTDARVAPKDSGPIDSSDKALAVVNKAHQAYVDAVKSGDPDRIQKTKDALGTATQSYQNFVTSATDIAGKKSAAEAAGRAPEQAANRQAGMQTEMQKTGAGLATKADAEYNDVTTKAANLKQSIQAAQKGDALAAAIAPLEGTLFVTGANGVKRINETELHGFQMAGGLKDRIEGWINGKISGDTIPADIKQGYLNMVDQYTKNEGAKYQRTLNSINQRHQTNFQPSSDYAQQPAQGGGNAPNGVPAGATHIYRDKNQQVVGYALDGQYHALNQ